MNVIDCLYEPVVVLTKDITMKVSEKNKSVIATNLVGMYLILINFEIMSIVIYHSNQDYDYKRPNNEFYHTPNSKLSKKKSLENIQGLFSLI